ncbi:HECT-domain-containing protein [Piedraia hortae CBS 480.64]|uniref:HECT-type E3 ubiquitin transferase n=1 Tax=Piedraia hortae CBS 480.64 TaxID=1314780 RepID=A0A6A7BZI7_9PEZI|nr:HECT-domain-containing protein [Piedraia hortae CBS 480.64]
MFQTFGGSSRKPRQVNLSGRPSNPFAAQSAVASAQHDRVQRERQRARERAAAQIQKTWRGHRERQRTRDIWRQDWDEREKRGTAGYQDESESLSQLRRLLLFFDPKEDAERLHWYGMRQIPGDIDRGVCNHGPWPEAYLRICMACIRMLKAEIKDQTTLNILTFAARRAKFGSERDAVYYYDNVLAVDVDKDSRETLLIAPLSSAQRSVYSGLAKMLTKALKIDYLAALKVHVDAKQLYEAVVVPQTVPSRLWLLGNLIYLTGPPKDILATSTIGHLLGSLVEVVDFEGNPQPIDNISFQKQVQVSPTLNDFLHAQLASLVSQNTVRNLFSDKSIIQPACRYALTLLRCFPTAANNIRMWLYLGPSERKLELPMTWYFWKGASMNETFWTIYKDSLNVFPVIESQSEDSTNDWTIILIFFELYTFLLKVIDDEEFIGNAYGGKDGGIPVDEVAILATFLKNLGLALYLNGPESKVSYYGASYTDPQEIPFAKIPGLKVSYLKDLVTGLLRSIYERDSRRRFLPEDHWVISNTRFDMTNFIPSVVAEEESRYTVQDESESDSESPNSPIKKPKRNPVVAPRLEILHNMPFFIPFMTRVEIFRQFVMLDQKNFLPNERHRTHRQATITRQHEFEDAFNHFYRLNAALKGRIQITFVNEFGISEPGIDGGGVTKEFLLSVTSQAFDPSQGYFVENDAHLLYPNPTTTKAATKPADLLNRYEFLGRIVGKCLYEGILIDIAFAPFFLKKWALTGGSNAASKESNYRPSINDLRDLDEGLYRGLLSLKSAPADSIESLNLTFSVDERINDEIVTYDLIPNGRDAPVTAENRLLYIHKLCSWKLQGQSAVQTGAFLKGLGEIISPNWLGMFNQHELQRLVGGSGAEIDLEDLKKNIVLTGLYARPDPDLLNLTEGARSNRNPQEGSHGNGFAPPGRVSPPGRSGLPPPAVNGEHVRESNTVLDESVMAREQQLRLGRETALGYMRTGNFPGYPLSSPRNPTHPPDHPTIEIFWRVIESFSESDKRQLLRFITSSPRAPLQGFGALRPPLTIRDAGTDEDRWPTASTCVNLLKLPVYRDEETLRRKVRGAIWEGAGFDLS